MNKESSIKVGRVLSPFSRWLFGALCVGIVLSLLAGAVSIPFLFESQTIKYKFGLDRTLLRTGQILGIMAGSLLLFQLVLSARLKILDRIFALNRLYFIHRINGVIVSLCALMHPLLVFAPEGVSNIPIKLKYWPEVLGAFLMLSIWLLTTSGLFRIFLNFSFERWYRFHRLVSFLTVAMLFVHVLFVSESFEAGFPRQCLFIVAISYGLFLAWVKIRPFLRIKKKFHIDSVTRAGKDAFAISLIPPDNFMLRYAPGQFAFVTVGSKNLTTEEHPFTIASSPTRPGNLLFTIRCSGDWTNHINRIQPGDTAVLDGPYGLFSHFASLQRKEFIMIAGGIGITPMLSMLRYMADVKDERRITLIWSNRTRGDIVFGEEFEELKERLGSLRIIHFFTRESQDDRASAHLERNNLETLLADSSRQAAVFICGPSAMMKKIQRNLLAIGFSRRQIFMEKFGL